MLFLRFFFLFSIFHKNKLSGIPFFGKKEGMFMKERKEDHINVTINNTLFYDKIKNINGFFGMIGPDIDLKENTTLFDLFTGNGIIQGMFLEKGNLTFIKKYIETEIFLYEKKNNKSYDNFFISNFLSTIHFGPKTLGYANTALLNVNDYLYALFERDMPYLIKINREKKDISTIGKINVKDIETFSAHSKYKNNKVETIDYNIFSKKVTYLELNEKIEKIIRKIEIPFKYTPLVHDFFSTDDHIVLMDTPIFIDTNHLFQKKIPLLLDKKQKTYLYVINKKTSERKTFELNESFYVFHYADLKENEDEMVIYACLYDELDFSTFYIKGNYRKIVIDKKTNITRIEKNDQLEKHNLDFPIAFENKIILRSLKNGNYNGFVICQDLKIEKYIELNDYFICGEPKVIYIEKTPYLLFYAFLNLCAIHGDCFNEKEVCQYRNENNFLVFINLNNYEKIQIPIFHSLQVGFHSVFIPFYNNET